MSNIEWTQETWNPVVGCSKVSQGCKFCYAEVMARRLKAMGRPQYQSVINGRWTGNLEFVPSALDKPLKRRKPTTYFVNSMSDLFHESVPLRWIEQVWDVMGQTPQHTYQILTKRADQMAQAVRSMVQTRGVLPNVWLGVSVEDTDNTHRIEYLTGTQAAIRFISFEPLLGDVGNVNLSGINWAIAGAESGHNARQMDEGWVRNIRDVCQRDRVAFFYKQNVVNGKKISLPALDGVVWDEIPF